MKPLLWKSFLYCCTLVIFCYSSFAEIRSIQHSDPEPIGGLEYLDLFVRCNVRMPLNEPGGSVTVKGLITPDGSSHSWEIVKGQNQTLDQEALRLMTAFKAWKPGLKKETPITYTLNLSENVNSDYKNELKGLVYYYNSKERRTAQIDSAIFKVLIPADIFGVPKKGNIEISKLLNGNWTVIEKGETKYIPANKLVYSQLKVESKHSELFTVESEANTLKLNLPVYTVSAQGQVMRAESMDGRSNWHENGVLKGVSVWKPKEGRLEYQWYPNGLLQIKKWVKGPGKKAIDHFVVA